MSDKVIDCSSMEFFKYGDDSWKKWTKELSDRKEVLLEKVPPFIINGVNLYRDYLPSGVTINSFYMPIRCIKCENNELRPITKDEDYIHSRPLHTSSFYDNKCSGCGGIAHPTVELSTYFKFLEEFDFNRYAVYDSFQSSVFVIDEDKRVRYVNEWGANIAGVSVKRLIKKMPLFHEVIELDVQHLFCMKKGSVGELEQSQIEEIAFSTPKGKDGQVKIIIHPDEDSPSGRKRWIVYMHDVSIEISLQNKYTNESQQKEAMYVLSTTDEMTGLNNYRAFTDQFQNELARVSRNKEEIGIAILDIDHFKKFNDEYGHLQGDKVLKVVAKAMQEGIRTTDFVARYGGEEFVLLFPSTNFAGVKVVLEKLRQSIADTKVENLSKEGEFLSVTASFGGIAVDGKKLFKKEINKELLKELIKDADKNLYEAKDGGRNKVVASEW